MLFRSAEVAHEIRNPLTVMKMLYHSLDLKFPTKDPRSEDARLMGEKIEHLNKIVERILDFARTTEPKLAPVHLNAVVEELCLLVRHKLANQGVKLTLALQRELPSVMGDAMQLEQAFLNLILNASEAMSDGGALTITTRTILAKQDTSPTQVIVEFADTGEGMSERNALEHCSSDMPSPVSANSTMTCVGFASRSAELVFVVMVSAPPSLMASLALRIRFRNACSSCIASPITLGNPR